MEDGQCHPLDIVALGSQAVTSRLGKKSRVKRKIEVFPPALLWVGKRYWPKFLFSGLRKNKRLRGIPFLIYILNLCLGLASPAVVLSCI